MQYLQPVKNPRYFAGKPLKYMSAKDFKLEFSSVSHRNMKASRDYDRYGSALETHFTYHKTVILSVYHKDGFALIRTGGYATKTTAERLNQLFKYYGLKFEARHRYNMARNGHGWTNQRIELSKNGRWVHTFWQGSRFVLELPFD